MRLIGAVFIILALIALGLDAMAAEDGFRLRSLAEAWFTLDRDSWLILQPALERYVHEDIWFDLVEPITQAPATLLFGGIGLALILLSRLIFGRRAA